MKVWGGCLEGGYIVVGCSHSQKHFKGLYVKNKQNGKQIKFGLQFQNSIIAIWLAILKFNYSLAGKGGGEFIENQIF